MMKIRMIGILLALMSCTHNSIDDQEELDKEVISDSVYKTKTLDFGEFKIDVPPTWQQIKASGIDSYVGLMALDKGDTVSFDLGWYSNSLEDGSFYVDFNGNVYVINTKSIPEFYGKADTVDIEKLKKNKTKWIVIDGKRAKIVQPKQTGRGMTGVYFDSLWMSGSGKDRFQMNGSNLVPENEIRLLKAFETLKFSKR